MHLDLPEMILDDGSKHRLRKAGLGDILTINRLLGQVLVQAGGQSELSLALGGTTSIEEFAGRLMMALAHAGEDLQSWLDTFAPVLRNGEKVTFSLLEYGRLLEALSKHPEILGFLASLQRLLKSPAAAMINKRLSKQRKS